MAAKNEHAKRLTAELPSSRTASQPTGIYMYAGELRQLPAPPKDPPSHLDDEDDYDDGGVVTVSVPAKEMENKAPFISKPAKKNNCRKLHVPVLYVLVAIGFAAWITFFFMILLKHSAISEKLQNLNLTYTEKFTENSEILEELQNQNLNYSEKFMKVMEELKYVKTKLMMAEGYTREKFTEIENILESFCSKGSISVALSCPHSWTRHMRHCYYFSTEKTNWTNALWNCNNSKAHLVSIWSDEEQNFLRNNLNKVDSYWLGMNDLEGQWKWKEGGLLLRTTFWENGQPSKEVNKDCGIMHPNGTWASAVCSLHYQWICKKKMIC